MPFMWSPSAQLDQYAADLPLTVLLKPRPQTQRQTADIPRLIVHPHIQKCLHAPPHGRVMKSRELTCGLGMQNSEDVIRARRGAEQQTTANQTRGESCPQDAGGMQKVPTSELARTQDCPKGCRGPSHVTSPNENIWVRPPRESHQCLPPRRRNPAFVPELGLPLMNLDPGMEVEHANPVDGKHCGVGV